MRLEVWINTGDEMIISGRDQVKNMKIKVISENRRLV